LERTLELHNPWILSQSKNISFGSNVSNLIFVNHFLFLHLFDGYHLVGLPVSAHSDLTESSSSNDFPWDEISYGYLGPL
jgi:hypothetical protein